MFLQVLMAFQIRIIKAASQVSETLYNQFLNRFTDSWPVLEKGSGQDLPGID